MVFIQIIKHITQFHLWSHGDTEVMCVGKPGENGRIGLMRMLVRAPVSPDSVSACTATPGQQRKESVRSTHARVSIKSEGCVSVVGKTNLFGP